MSNDAEYRWLFFLYFQFTRTASNSLLIDEIKLLRTVVKQVIDWPYSSFHNLVISQVYPTDWGGRTVILGVGESS